MNPEADEKKLKKQGVVQGGVCSRILVNVHVMHVGTELGAPLAIWMVHIDGAHFETFVSTDMGRVEGSKGSLVKENEGNHRLTSLTSICKKMLKKEKRKKEKSIIGNI